MNSREQIYVSTEANPPVEKMCETMDFKTLDIKPQRTVIYKRWK